MCAVEVRLLAMYTYICRVRDTSPATRSRIQATGAGTTYPEFKEELFALYRSVGLFPGNGIRSPCEPPAKHSTLSPSLAPVVWRAYYVKNSSDLTRPQSPRFSPTEVFWFLSSSHTDWDIKSLRDYSLVCWTFKRIPNYCYVFQQSISYIRNNLNVR